LCKIVVTNATIRKPRKTISHNIGALIFFVVFGILCSFPVNAGTVSVRFGYGTTSHIIGDFLKYDVITDWIEGYYTGNWPALNISGLKANTTYYYRVQIKNGDVIVTSENEQVFVTLPEPTTTPTTTTTTSIPKTTQTTVIPSTTTTTVITPPEDKLDGGSIIGGGTYKSSSLPTSSGELIDIFPILFLAFTFVLLIRNGFLGSKGLLIGLVIVFILIMFATTGLDVLQNVINGL
jgi:hypothetical protein